MKQKPIVIVGGGLSGLACALTLKQQGLPYLLFERRSEIGGRVATRKAASGFTLDEGFQVLLDSYPELPRFLDLDRLELEPFHSGAMIFDGKKMRLLANPLRHPKVAVANMFGNKVSFADQLRVLTLVAKARKVVDDGAHMGLSTLSFLETHGFSQDFIESFWRPFMAGVYLDENLSADAGFFLFLVRCFGLGAATVPAKGMAEIPRQMLARLDADRVRTSTQVVRITDSSISLASGETIEAQAVVKAFTEAAPDGANFHSVETHYFSVGRRLDWDRWLVLVPPQLGLKINHLALMSEVASSYAPTGRQLLQVSVVGPKTAPIEAVIKEVEMLAGHPCSLEHLESIAVPLSLPIVKGPTTGFVLSNGIYQCGDGVSSPSINGALRSGRLAAEAIIERLPQR